MNKLSIIIVALLFITAIWGQYELRESYYGSGGPVGATGGGYELWGSATGQTAVTTVSDGSSYEDQQGFYHGKMYKVRFKARDVQRDSWTIWGNDNDVDGNGVNDELYVRIEYLYCGVWKEGYIGYPGHEADELVVWVDAVQTDEVNYKVLNDEGKPEAEFVSDHSSSCSDHDPCDPNYHRWAPKAADAEGRITSGDQTNPAEVTIDFWEQFRCEVLIKYDPDNLYEGTPPPTYAGGFVNGISWRQFGGPIYEPNNFWEHGGEWADNKYFGYPSYGNSEDDVPEVKWIDKDSKLSFPENTTENWYTINSHVFDPLDKSIIKTITYQQPFEVASNILWRRYTLIGVPLFPREDYSSYPSECGTPTDFGDQDVVLWDDLNSDCDKCDGNLLPEEYTCGKWELWYRVMRYHTSSGGYRRYLGPDNDETNPHRFEPGYGFWVSQNHCDQIPFDVYGVMADQADSIEMPLYQITSSPPSPSYMQYNMFANPFYDKDPGNIPVDVSKWRIRNNTTSETVSINTAVTVKNWIFNPIYVYREVSPGVWNYFPLEITSFGADQNINEWEGFWILTNPTGAADQDLTLIMYTKAAAPDEGALAREIPEHRWSLRLSCEIGNDGDYLNYAGFSTVPNSDAFEPTEIMFPPDNPNPVRLYYVKDGRNLASAYYNEEQNLYCWNVRLEPGAQQGQDARLFWNLDSIPPEYAVMLKIPGYDEINLRTRNEVVLHNVQKPIDMELFVYPAVSSVAANNGLTPGDFFISNAVPNPFNATATIKFGIPAGHGDFVSIEIIDISGHKVKTLWNKSTEAGYHTVVWDGTDESGKTVPAGTYFCRIVHPEFVATKRTVLVK